MQEYRTPPTGVSVPPPYSTERLAALVLGLPGFLLVVVVAALFASGHVSTRTAAGGIAAGAAQMLLAAALWMHLRAARPLALLLSLVWAALLLALGDDRLTPPLLLPAVVAVALLLPLPGRTGVRLQRAVARGRATAPPGAAGTVATWSLPVAALAMIAEGVWLAVSTVAALLRDAATPGLGAIVGTAARFVVALVEVPVELLLFPAVGLLVLSGHAAARGLAIVLQALVLLGAATGGLHTARAQVSAGLAIVVVLLLMAHARALDRA